MVGTKTFNVQIKTVFPISRNDISNVIVTASIIREQTINIKENGHMHFYSTQISLGTNIKLLRRKIEERSKRFVKRQIPE